jgi:hypothetical protein
MFDSRLSGSIPARRPIVAFFAATFGLVSYNLTIEIFMYKTPFNCMHVRSIERDA